MLQKNDYVFTDDMRTDLRRYLNGEPTFGRYTPNLHFTPQPDQAADADQQAAPDPFYHQAQGQEPPPAKKRLWFRNNVELTVMLSCIAVLLLVLVFWPVG